MRKVLVRFIKDRLLFVFFYLLSIVCIITFYHLSTDNKTELLYPILIGLFLLFVCLIIDWFRYYPMNLAVEKMLHNEFTQLEPKTNEQNAFKQLVDKKFREHTSKYNNLKKQNEKKLYFLSHWMHHLKTPISVIELIISKEKNESEDIYDKILEQNNRLYHSIEQGLTMLRIDKIENDLEIKSIDLIESLRKLINRRKKEFIYQKIYPVIECKEKEAFVVTDEKWNEIMINQIISNAIKYSSTKEGKKKLTFHIEKNEKYITLAIIDEGIGIPSYDLERVFEPFFTGENGRKISNSTGIGLYLCKQIADKLNHEISIESNVSQGTTVKIRWLTREDD